MSAYIAFELGAAVGVAVGVALALALCAWTKRDR